MNCLLAMACGAFFLQAPSDESRGSISGRIVSARTGEGLSGVSIQLTGWGDLRLSRSAVSAADGAFSFQGLAAGAYALTASKSRHRPAQALPLRLNLDKNQSRAAIEIKFHGPSVITGRVRDTAGAALVGAGVTAFRIEWMEGGWIASRSGSATADDRGYYSISDLPAGRYVVAATPAEPPLIRTFYPSADHAGTASPVPVRWDQEVTNLDIVVGPRANFRVAGQILDAEARRSCASCEVSALNLEDRYHIPLQGKVSPADGSYQIQGLTPGGYRIVAQKLEARRIVRSGTVVQIGDQNLTGVHLVTGLAKALVGRVVLDSPPRDFRVPSAQVVFHASTGVPYFVDAQVKEDLSFETSELAAETYIVRVQGFLPGGYMKGLRVSGRDLPGPELQVPEDGLAGPVEIVIGFDSASLTVTGKPREGASEPASILLSPAESTPGFAVEQRVSTNDTGAATISGIAPGSYRLYALPPEPDPEWNDPDLRRRSPHGVTVRLEPGKSLQIEVVPVPATPLP